MSQGGTPQHFLASGAPPCKYKAEAKLKEQLLSPVGVSLVSLGNEHISRYPFSKQPQLTPASLGKPSFSLLLVNVPPPRHNPHFPSYSSSTFHPHAMGSSVPVLLYCMLRLGKLANRTRPPPFPLPTASLLVLPGGQQSGRALPWPPMWRSQRELGGR